jgi:serine/threonine-protein kinase
MSERGTPSRTTPTPDDPAPAEASLDSAAFVDTGSVDSELLDSVLQRVAGAHGALPQATPPAVGSVLGGKYRIESPLGRGGMGFVFRARHVVTGRAIALKWMLPRHDAEQSSQRFRREAEAIGRIRHPNVVDIYDVESTAEATYLVMELLDGETLRQRLSRGRLEIEEAVGLGLPLLHALKVAHEKGVIHRDLKPENVFLAEGDTERPTPKILDFGISTLTEGESLEKSQTLTQTGHFIGTPLYTPLERLRENQPFDHRVDLYSVGVMLYEAMAGTPPFSARSVSELTFQLATTTPTPLRHHRPEVPAALEDIVMKALSRDPADRPPDASSFAAALRTASAKPEVSSGPPARALESALQAPVARAAERSRTKLVWSGLVGVLVLTAAVVAAVTSRPAPTDASTGPSGRTPAAVSLAAPTPPVPAAPTGMESRPHSEPQPTLAPSEAPATTPPASAALPVPIRAQGARPPPESHERPVTGTKQPPAAGAVTETAQLTIVAFPYGFAWVDGVKVGASPVTKAVSAGTHVVEAGRDAPERKTTITVAAGETRRVVLSLRD